VKSALHAAFQVVEVVISRRHGTPRSIRHIMTRSQ
jgi:hypothetical protein